MTSSVRLIKAVLADAEGWQNQGEAVQGWLKCLEEVAYDADNVLDELHYESLRHQVESRNRHKLEVCCFSFFSNINLAFRWRMASKVRDIKLKLKGINEEANQLGLVSRLVMTAALPAVPAPRIRQTDSYAVKTFGRDDDRSKMVEILLRPSEKVLSVLPIVGMGGVGKTTLAKSIYNNERIAGDFFPIWVCVSKEVEIVELFRLILVQLQKNEVGVHDREIILDQIRKELGVKKYFLVLDDVWDDNDNDNVQDGKVASWSEFFTALKGLNQTKGSWCLITTRSHLVANIVSRILMMDTEPHVLGRLANDDCWSILKEKAVGEQEVPNELDAIKDRVIKKCDGLPLAASVLGGLLCVRERGEWQSILENRLLRLNGVTEILKLSFDNLPSPAIKKCFAYCSIFPKDTEMERDMLTELWMAEGFLHADLKNQMMMEEIGINYMRILLQSSLFEEIRDDWKTFYKMHDLVHDLAVSMSKSTKVINYGDTYLPDNGSGNQIRYLAVVGPSSGEGREKLFESLSTSLHTLFVSDCDTLMKLRNLYVLTLSDAIIGELPTSIGKLIHLRYIKLSRYQFSILPDSLCKLYNLQTLNLHYTCVRELPKGMSNLISLRHLHYDHDGINFQMPLEMGRLTCLQTLEFFNVGQEKGRQIGELAYLKNLRGKLVIRNLQLVKDKEGAEEANLLEKTSLFGLHLTWAVCGREDGIHHEDVDVLEGLKPHPNLEELEIAYFMGDQLPRWLMDLPATLPRLASLRFYQCRRCREFPPLQNYTSLKELLIYVCNGLMDLPGGMLQSCSSLQKLRVSFCHNLISFPLDLQHTPSLLELELKRCHKLKTSMTPKGFGSLTGGLRKLVIGPFSDDDDNENSSIYNKFDWSGLISSSLRELHLHGLPHMESLPHQLQHLTTLTSLHLEDFEDVEALPDWFGNFAALERLVLRNFKKLQHLPSEDAMRHLTKLKYLLAHGSPLLKERCNPQSTGPDSQWSKVSHIQSVQIYASILDAFYG